MSEENELLILARNMLGGDIGIISGARAIAERRDYFLFHDTKLAYEDIAIFFDIDTEAKHLPIDEGARGNWDAQALQEKNEQARAIEQKYRTVVTEHCRRIIQKLGEP